MPEGPFVFLDFDDTLSDQIPFMLQYVREIGGLMAPKFGGEVEVWAKSAADMLVAVEEDYLQRFVNAPLSGYCDWLNSLRFKTVELLFAGMRLPVPANAPQLSAETQFQALLKCNHTFPGAYEALSEMYESGCRLQVASGQESEFLLAALMGGRLESFVESRFGPDLIDCAKEGVEYYTRVFEATGVRPEEVVIVDDYPPAIGWALEIGATVLQAKLSRERHFDTVPGVAAVVTDLSALPALVKQHSHRK